MSFSGEGYSTLEEHLEAQASPILERSHLNFDSLETPPPYIDAPDDYHSSDTEVDSHQISTQLREAYKDRPQPSLCDSLLITALGPTYPPDIAARAGIELLCDTPERESSAGPSTSSDAHDQMIGVERADLSASSILDQTNQILPAPREASQALHDALDRKYRSMSIRSNGEDVHVQYRVDSKSPVEFVARPHRHHNFDVEHIRKASIESIIEIREVSPSNDNTFSKDHSRNAGNSARPTLPHLEIAVSSSIAAATDDPMMKSPSLARHVITPLESHPYQTLAKIHSSNSPESSLVALPETRQTLPSLQTALNSATDSNGTPYLGPSPSLAGSALTQVASPFGTSPATYAHASPNASMSPPRLTANPSFWRSNSQNSSVSTPPEQGSTTLSANASTPASSVPGQSPANSLHTPIHVGSELPSQTDVDHSHRNVGVADVYVDMAQQAGMSLQGFRCMWPGCTAPPFQTQYLLNSHTNVHSNTRPHFCPVQGCPRGPGGQGFKRKNEMIRHGLVHQSPGYVCPFCPDQQHKYPRPDNLQRHVRVHHVDKDRDDPLLREVLAQRPEGGNRGRRRRIGT